MAWTLNFFLLILYYLLSLYIWDHISKGNAWIKKPSPINIQWIACKQTSSKSKNAEKCVIDHTLGMSLAVRVPGRSAWPSFVASRRCSSDTGGTWSGPASCTRAQATQAWSAWPHAPCWGLWNHRWGTGTWVAWHPHPHQLWLAWVGGRPGPGTSSAGSGRSGH